MLSLFLHSGKFDLTVNNYEPLRRAASLHFPDIALQLLDVTPDVNVSATQYEMLRNAVEQGHVGLVKRLLSTPSFDPNDPQGNFLARTLQRPPEELFELFLGLPSVDSLRITSSLFTVLKLSHAKTLLAHPKFDPQMFGWLKAMGPQIYAGPPPPGRTPQLSFSFGGLPNMNKTDTRPAKYTPSNEEVHQIFLLLASHPACPLPKIAAELMVRPLPASAI